MKVVYLLLLFFLNFAIINAEKENVKIFVANQLNQNVIWGTIKGDHFYPRDTVIFFNDFVRFHMPNNINYGVCRLVLGQSAIAKVMNEPPQQLDFIFNGEDIVIETDFNAPLDSAKDIESLENQIWFEFLRKEKIYQEQVKELVMQINHFQKNDDTYYTLAKRTEIIGKYNKLQKDRDKLIASVTQNYPNLYASKLIKIKQEPFLNGNLSEQEREEVQKKHYFDNIDFSDESLMNSSAYTDKVFKYFMLYAQKGLSKEKKVDEFKKAIDVILYKTSQNPNVSAFIVDYLMRGFEKLGLDNLQTHISDFYMIPHGCSGDNNTLERRLAFQQMKKGDKIPDFTLDDWDGEQFKLYQSDTDYKLILFWETSCPMCKKILPPLKNWYFNKNIDLEVFAISIDEDKKAWKTSISKNDYPWINLNEANKWDGKVATAYNLYATPTMFLLDGENRILAKPIDFNGLLEAVLGLE
ncbi:TlpA family protein disulfide reductase [Saccharicrinis fermentans]|uniref:Thiol-disulfide oxidoreductase ResA n=1 Tax=Saccharicrinis fermentans DSM 9555 = JCM 21142 TaxID=869213 RepID=W7YTL0_9BACT|nr:TlpA disulfide reductase family protein [Saccharicrinis fermentans]GAF05794.1 thiol-disulfide oxidoreductase ResA [Saccharicrinis fermentans DSM 9555 = JCM 21142]